MVEESLFLHDLPEMSELGFAARALDRLRLLGEIPQLAHLLPDLPGVFRQRDRLQQSLQTLAFGFLELVQLVPVGKVRWGGSRQLLGALETLFQPPGPVLQRAPHGIGAGREPSLVERHQEPHCPRPGVVAFGRGPAALPFHEPRDPLVEVELGAVDGKGGRARDALGEDWLCAPGSAGFRLREIDHRLLGPAQIEGRPPPIHGVADGFHVGVGVPIEELQEQREVLRISFVRCCRQQKQVVGAVAQQLSQPVAPALVGLVTRRHAMGLIHDHQVPPAWTR